MCDNLKEFTKIDGNLRKSLEIYEIQLESMKPNGNRWKPMTINGNPRKSKKIKRTC